MEDSENHCWNDIIPEVLGLILRNLSLEEILTIISRVCKSWRKTVLGPYCWQEINILEWSKNCNTDLIYRMLQMLIPRSDGSLHKLSVSRLPSDSCLSLIAEYGKVLHTLELPESVISNSIVECVAEKFSALTFLDLSYCSNISAPAIEAFGKYCSNLTGFWRIMPPYEMGRKVSRDDEALAIAYTMHKLKRLELALHINTESVVKILENCLELEFLNVLGCPGLKLEEKLMNKFSRVMIIGSLDADSGMEFDFGVGEYDDFYEEYEDYVVHGLDEFVYDYDYD